jgi:hypothetical protein
MSDSKQHDDIKNSPTTKKRIVRLDDLDWEDEVTGGSSGKFFFGELPEVIAPPGDVLKPPGNTSQGPKGA